MEQTTTNRRLTKQNQDSSRQQPTHQPTINITFFEQLSTEVTVDSEQFSTTAESRDSRLQTENVDLTSLPTEQNEVSTTSNPYGTTEDDLYNPTSLYNLMTSRPAVGSKHANITGTAVVTIVIICFCILGGLSFIAVITIIIIKRKQVDKSATTNHHFSNARGLDFENPAYKIYDLQNLDKEYGVSRTEDGLPNFKDSKL
ncbi:uncharacterized protein LOC117124952 [Anneissia japonica]|uniref:uncharacterized protein LOC117124952 n=1 Tax=Anneissia japonica TaxID=1529436 RepID=UPI001425AE09|nr:uncharacterized protein LOC117124952 [Anneissia japonica]